MKLSPLGRDLYQAIAEMSTIDAHQHLPSEEEYLSFGYSGLNMFAGGYIWHDLESAGMSPTFKATMRDGGDRPVDQWWPEIKPFWEQVRNTSYARALRITVRDLWGIEEIDDATIHQLAERVKADNTPGLYKRALQDRCLIRYSITCIDQASFPDDPGLCGITRLIKARAGDRDIVASLAARWGQDIQTLGDAAIAAQSLLRRDIADGAIGFKMGAGHHDPPDAGAAERELKRVLATPGRTGPLPALQDYLFDKCLDVAAEADVPVAVHTGYWGDFRQLDPKHLFSFALRRPDVRYDMFHLGMPMVRDAALMGKTLPNVTLNLTWCPVISQLQTRRILGEIIDLVPLNKVIAFGGDYRVAVQKTYGHLVMAREAVASVLADRVEAGDFDREYALHIARLWFHDNPSRIYKLGDGQGR